MLNEYSKSIWDDDNMTAITCPVCGFDYVHPEKVVINAGGVITSIEGKFPVIGKGKPAGRGVSVWQYFWCEDGHRWVERYQFHKGTTLRKTTIINDTDNKLDGEFCPPTMWRD